MTLCSPVNLSRGALVCGSNAGKPTLASFMSKLDTGESGQQTLKGKSQLQCMFVIFAPSLSWTVQTFYVQLEIWLIEFV